jgi:hypothetical protein
MTIIGILDYWRIEVEFTVSQEILRLKHGDSSGTQWKGTSAVGSCYQRIGEKTAD